MKPLEKAGDNIRKVTSSVFTEDKILFTSSACNGFIVFKGYVSKMETELLDGMVGYSLSFNVIQSEGAPWQ